MKDLCIVDSSTVTQSRVQLLKETLLLLDGDCTASHMGVLDVSLNSVAQCPAQRKCFGELLEDEGIVLQLLVGLPNSTCLVLHIVESHANDIYHVAHESCTDDLNDDRSEELYFVGAMYIAVADCGYCGDGPV